MLARLTALFLILSAAAVATGQTNTNAVTLRVLPHSTGNLAKVSRLQTEYVDFAYLAGGVRQWGNEVVDLRPAKPEFYNGRSQVEGFYLIGGNVISVNAEGVLLSTDMDFTQSGKLVFLFRPHRLEWKVDGQRMAVIAKKMEAPYVYKSAGGARKTVEAYDCGEQPENKWILELNARAAAESEKKEAARKDAAAKYNAAVKDAADKRMSEAKARAEKARAEREAKEKAEKEKK